MNYLFPSSGVALTDLIVGASIYFPPAFKAVLIGFVFWLLLHQLLREWLYSGEVWHPTLMDLSIFALSISAALLLLTL